RVDLAGNILKQDSATRAREILSPALPRNGFTTLRIVIKVPKGKHYALLAAQNPDNATEMKVYRELPATAETRVRDRLELVKSPSGGDGNGLTESSLLDLFVPEKAPVRRVRIEAQLNDGSGWFIYPMEVRVIAAIVPHHRVTHATPPPPTVPSDAPA